MLYWLADLAQGGGVFNLFRYITFRRGSAGHGAASTSGSR